MTTQVAADMSSIETALGEKVAVFWVAFVTCIYGFINAFFKCWQLSLALTGALPFLVIAGAFMSKSMLLLSQKNKVSYEEASSVTEQSFSGIRTIKSLVGEWFEKDKFTAALTLGRKKANKYNLFAAMSFGLIFFVFMSIYSYGFWFGKYLIIKDPTKYNSTDIVATFFSFIIGGSSISQISPIMKNVAEGRVAIGKLLKIMKREKTLI